MRVATSFLTKRCSCAESALTPFLSHGKHNDLTILIVEKGSIRTEESQPMLCQCAARCFMTIHIDEIAVMVAVRMVPNVATNLIVWDQWSSYTGDKNALVT